jgi:hypothetical protein
MRASARPGARPPRIEVRNRCASGRAGGPRRGTVRHPWHDLTCRQHVVPIGRRLIGICRRSLHACRFQSSFWIGDKICSRNSPVSKIIMDLLNKSHNYSGIQRQQIDFSRCFDIACTEHLQLSLSAFFTVSAPADSPSPYPKHLSLYNHRIRVTIFRWHRVCLVNGEAS